MSDILTLSKSTEWVKLNNLVETETQVDRSMAETGFLS